MKTAKKIYIENIEEFDYLLTLESQIKGKSVTSLIEEHIFNDLIKTKNARIYIEEFIHKDMNLALKKIFDDIAEGKDTINKTEYNLKKLFDFTLKQADATPGRGSRRMTIENIFESFLPLIVYLENWLKDNKSQEKESRSSQLIYKNYCILYEQMVSLYEERGNLSLNKAEHNIFDILFKGWKVFYKDNATYKLLSRLEATMQDYKLNNKITLDWEFVELINEITN